MHVPRCTCGSQRQLIRAPSLLLPRGSLESNSGILDNQTWQHVPLVTEPSLQASVLCFQTSWWEWGTLALWLGFTFSSWPVVLGILRYGYCWWFLPYFHGEVVDGLQGQVHSGCNAGCSRIQLMAPSLGFPICDVERTLCSLSYCV